MLEHQLVADGLQVHGSRSREIREFGRAAGSRWIDFPQVHCVRGVRWHGGSRDVKRAADIIDFVNRHAGQRRHVDLLSRGRSAHLPDFGNARRIRALMSNEVKRFADLRPRIRPRRDERQVGADGDRLRRHRSVLHHFQE